MNDGGGGKPAWNRDVRSVSPERDQQGVTTLKQKAPAPMKMLDTGHHASKCVRDDYTSVMMRQPIQKPGETPEVLCKREQQANRDCP